MKAKYYVLLLELLPFNGVICEDRRDGCTWSVQGFEVVFVKTERAEEVKPMFTRVRLLAHTARKHYTFRERSVNRSSLQQDIVVTFPRVTT